jgi:hypothetical protein
MQQTKMGQCFVYCSCGTTCDNVWRHVDHNQVCRSRHLPATMAPAKSLLQHLGALHAAAGIACRTPRDLDRVHDVTLGMTLTA